MNNRILLMQRCITFCFIVFTIYSQVSCSFKYKYETELNDIVAEHLNKRASEVTKKDYNKITGITIQDAIFDFAELRKLPNLVALGIYNCNSQIDLNELYYLEKLVFLAIEDVQLLNTQVFKKFKNLEELSIVNTNLSNIEAICDLTKLHYLNLTNNAIDDIRPLDNLKSIRVLILDRNEIKDITPIKNLTTLNEISVIHNKVKVVPQLSKLIRLNKVYFQYNEIEDASFMKSLEPIDTIDLTSNLIRDFSWIQSIKGLNTIYIKDNPISEKHKEELIKIGEERGIKIYFE